MTRFDILGLGLLAGSFLLCLLGFTKLQSNTEDVLQWLPDNSEARQEYDVFAQKFGSDDFLIVTWDGCTLDDPRLEQFCQQLKDNDSDGLIRSVYNGTDIIKELASTSQLSRKVVQQRFKGIYFGIKDQNQTLALIELSKAGASNRRESLEHIELVIDNLPDLELDDTIFGGYPYVGVSLDNQLRDSFRYLLLPSILLASIVSLGCLRNFSLSMIVFFAAFGASACSVAIVPLLGVKFGGLMAIIPALVYILATSGGIHLTHYSLEAIGDSKKLLSIGWRPCVVSAVTTAIGMLSLGRSGFPAIRSFGFFCASGAMFALLYQLIAIPWLLERFGSKGQHALAGRNDRNRFWSAVPTAILRFKPLIVFAGLALMIACSAGLFRLSARVQVDKLFNQDSPIIASLTDLDSRIGPIEQSEFMIIFNNVSQENFHLRAKLVNTVERHLDKQSYVGTTHSLDDYLPREPRGSGVRAAFRRSAYQNQLDLERDRLAKGRFLSIDGTSETWRISLRFPFIAKSDVQLQKEKTLAEATKVVKAFRSNEKNVAAGPFPRFIYTGKNYLFLSAQRTLLKDLFGNFLLAFVVITPVLIVVLRSLSLGLIAMLPNLFPIVVLFGILGWCNLPVDLAIAMTASVALGIAVDDTTHFLIRFREFGGNLSNIKSPLRKAITQCGPAMFHTTSIGTAGLIVYGFSDMPVVRNFCLAISAMLVLALVADIFWLPALLAIGQRKNRSDD